MLSCPPTPEWKPEQCPPPAPATTPDPTTSSNPDYDTFVAVIAALSNVTGVAIKNELNKNEIALNYYFIIKPYPLRVLHDSDPYRMIFQAQAQTRVFKSTRPKIATPF